MKKGRILTGHRPTGRRHMGHWLGTLENWRRLQDDYECFFLIADLHVLTTKFGETESIRDNIVETVRDWLAAGIDPLKSTFVLQSAVPEHAELQLLFSMLVTVERLGRNPTYKEQKKELHLGKNASLGLLSYPVLQAADILIYRADTVPVGEDQLPHIELTREIARRFNYLYGDTFPEPQGLLSPSPRIPGLDGRMMHTSYDNAIPLSASEDEVRQKVSSMVTDPLKARLNDPGRPEVCSAYALLKAFDALIPVSGSFTVEKVAADCRGGCIGCVADKSRFADVYIKSLLPFRTIREKVPPEVVWEILASGTHKAREVARETMEMTRERMHFTHARLPF
ncbi:MAG: tryptophan--tRNA ligase [Dehalococcoidia bacterium]|nr:tryptophan--tRNA ligase [Dehalococcoidia bacterium]